MADRHYGLTPEVAGCYQQAARVCLDRHHAPPTDFQIEDERGALGVWVAWAPAAERERAAGPTRRRDPRRGIPVRARRDRGADGLYAMRRVQVGGRADYYVAPEGAPATT
jgi:hypothetical protein